MRWAGFTWGSTLRPKPPYAVVRHGSVPSSFAPSGTRTVTGTFVPSLLSANSRITRTSRIVRTLVGLLACPRGQRRQGPRQGGQSGCEREPLAEIRPANASMLHGCRLRLSVQGAASGGFKPFFRLTASLPLG